MQSGPSSKPLLLVIIGLILGASLGLGSGYAILYPQLIRESNQSIEDRIQELEDSLSAMDAQIGNLNGSIDEIKGSLGTILLLSQSVNTLGGRITALEGSMNQVNGKVTALEASVNQANSRVTGLEDDVGSLGESFAAFQEDWSEALGGLSDVEEGFQAVNAQVAEVQDRVSQTLAVGRLTTYMANPAQANVAVLTDALHSVLMAENAVYAAWARAYGETTAKILLTPVLDGMMGGLVWNRVSVSVAGGNVYQVRLETYTGLDFTAAGVTVPKIRLEARANVNVLTGEVASFSWSVVDIV